MLIVLHS